MNLNQVTLPSLHLDISIPFYQSLGLTLIVHSSPDYARFACPSGDSTFSLHRVSELAAGERAWIYFELDNLDEKVTELQEKGFVFEHLPIDQPWLWREARLHDPDGNVLILFHAGINRKDPPWKLKPEYER
jgi:catechol 2,3-dioxygenase-like lactoylglutathione lyase family enzyme